MTELSQDQEKIVKYIVKNTSYGENKEVQELLSKLIPNLSNNKDLIISLQKEHNEEHLAIAQDKTQKFVLHPLNWKEDGDNCYYIDQTRGKKIFVDHLTLELLNVEDTEVEKHPAFENYKVELEKALQKYVNQFYNQQNVAFSIYVEWGEEDFTIYVNISCKNLQLKSFHMAEWLSEWKIHSKGVKGKVRVNSRYFETGNVALRLSKEFNEDIELKGENFEQEACDIVKFIQKQEGKLLDQLEEQYSEISSGVFKSMRRLLPMTNQKMNWAMTIMKAENEFKKSQE